MQSTVHLTQLLARPLVLSGGMSQEGVPTGSINCTAGSAGALQGAKYIDTYF